MHALYKHFCKKIFIKFYRLIFELLQYPSQSHSYRPTVITLITRTIQLFEHPPPLFPEKCLFFFVFQAFEPPRLKLLFQYPNIYIATPRGARTGVAERLLAFDSLCRARARVNERLLAY